MIPALAEVLLLFSFTGGETTDLPLVCLETGADFVAFDGTDFAKFEGGDERERAFLFLVSFLS